MSTSAAKGGYRPTESKYKGGAKERFVPYDLEQKTRGGGTAIYPKVKRVYIAGNVTGWQAGRFTKRSGRSVSGVKIEYHRSRTGYDRRPYSAERGSTEYEVGAAHVPRTSQTYTQIVETPERARNVRFHDGPLPQEYRSAAQCVR
ncbi:MAG TPA: hypothetical protein VGS41_12545 [Chthonomonadales bacterium]|nr:hypothetical protein [Chthonomonadales bacterium]